MYETGMKMVVPVFILNETELDDGYSRCQEEGPALNRVAVKPELAENKKTR
jgi:hypothetical protein